MAKTTTSVQHSNDDLIAMLLGNTQQQVSGPTAGEQLRLMAANAAASSLKTTAIIAGAFTGAMGNAQQAFTLEKNFRTAERQLKAKRMAEAYVSRLQALNS